ncbi:hypothetical protein [Microbispora amethystogenes]|uniref:Protein kinase domain-containing protein n=1 Tax=Microbispora amethystogenes TaxID=1427754 RepID=A0ABQ4F7F6_9ACTN|nr:hypothetical protein [Microbispora amethystogenes]GIH30693.1 hypothetical protein Mam01_08570 [Microbispora amethystogenes]
MRRVAPFCTAQVLDADLDGDCPYIVSEYVDGPSLRDHVAAAGPRTGGDLDRVAVGTATALAAIHRAGVVHRDFKPGDTHLAVMAHILYGMPDLGPLTGTLRDLVVACLAPDPADRPDAGQVRGDTCYPGRVSITPQGDRTATFEVTRAGEGGIRYSGSLTRTE